MSPSCLVYITLNFSDMEQYLSSVLQLGYTHEVSFASSLNKKDSDPLFPWGMSNPEKQQSIHGDERGAINE